MTNGEKFKQTFHATEGEHTQDDLIIPVSVGEIRMCFLAKWWNAEYKEPKEIHLIPIGNKPSIKFEEKIAN